MTAKVLNMTVNEVHPSVCSGTKVPYMFRYKSTLNVVPPPSCRLPPPNDFYSQKYSVCGLLYCDGWLRQRCIHESILVQMLKSTLYLEFYVANAMQYIP
jgi:hypothetical protein